MIIYIYIEYNIINTIYIWYMCVAYSCACAYGREREMDMHRHIEIYRIRYAFTLARRQTDRQT